MSATAMRFESVVCYDLQPLTREVHAVALTALYNSYADFRAKEQFANEHWGTDESQKTAIASKLADLRTAIDYHKQCYDACPSCDDPI